MKRRNIFQTAFAAIAGPRLIEAAQAAPAKPLSVVDQLFHKDAEIIRNGTALYQKWDTVRYPKNGGVMDGASYNRYGVKWGDGDHQISPEFWADNCIEAQDAARTWAVQNGHKLDAFGLYILP